jgi:hypothetical protein
MRRWKLLGAMGLAVLVAVGVFVLWPRPDRITRENCDRIRKGMSRAEVYAILGPPGDYGTGPVKYETAPYIALSAHNNLEHFSQRPEGQGYATWQSDSALAFVNFSDAGCVDDRVPAYFFKGGRVPQGPFDNLLWRAKRLWRRWFPE